MLALLYHVLGIIPAYRSDHDTVAWINLGLPKNY